MVMLATVDTKDAPTAIALTVARVVPVAAAKAAGPIITPIPLATAATAPTMIAAVRSVFTRHPFDFFDFLLLMGRMRYVIIPLLLLVGCTTTPAELKSREIVGTFQTNKPASTVAACLAENFSRLGAPLILDHGEGKQVSFNHDGSTVLMFTIAAGTVSVQRANSLLAYREKTAACV